MQSHINKALRVTFSMLAGIWLAHQIGYPWDSIYAFFAGFVVLAIIHFAAAVYIVISLLIERKRGNG